MEPILNIINNSNAVLPKALVFYDGEMKETFYLLQYVASSGWIAICVNLPKILVAKNVLPESSISTFMGD